MPRSGARARWHRHRHRSPRARSGRFARGSRPGTWPPARRRPRRTLRPAGRAAPPRPMSRSRARLGHVSGKPPHERQAVRQTRGRVVEQTLGVLGLGKSGRRRRDPLGHGLGSAGALVPAGLSQQAGVIRRDLARPGRRDGAARAPRRRRAMVRSRSCGRPRAAPAQTARGRLAGRGRQTRGPTRAGPSPPRPCHDEPAARAPAPTGGWPPPAGRGTPGTDRCAPPAATPTWRRRETPAR